MSVETKDHAAPKPKFSGKLGWVVNLGMAFISLALTFIVAEVAFRQVLFSDSELLAKQRLPGLYADYSYEDDYWKLQYRWLKRYPPPKNPHPELGWGFGFDPETYLHSHAGALRGGRRPVLLYGDSFAQGVAHKAKTINSQLNGDPEFAREHVMLNYGVGGYGLDQIVMLMEKSLHHYLDAENPPYVVLSFMTYDVDRSMLSMRTGQKPYFAPLADGLEIRGLPIAEDPHAFFAEQKLDVRSFLWRRMLFAKRYPNRVVRWLRGEASKKRHKQELNEKILERAVAFLTERDVEFTILVFHPKLSLLGHPDWRDAWLEEYFDEHDHDVIWSKSVLAEHAPGFDIDELAIKGNGHPTTLYNQLMADQIARWVYRSTPGKLAKSMDSK